MSRTLPLEISLRFSKFVVVIGTIWECTDGRNQRFEERELTRKRRRDGDLLMCRRTEPWDSSASRPVTITDDF